METALQELVYSPRKPWPSSHPAKGTAPVNLAEQFLSALSAVRHIAARRQYGISPHVLTGYTQWYGFSKNPLAGGIFEQVWLEALQEKSVSRPVSRAVPFDLIDFYEDKIEKGETASRKEENNRLRVEAWMNRELMSALMDEEWLGLQVLAYLRSFPALGATELAKKLEADIDNVATLLARLFRYGGVSIKEKKFNCTEQGLSILERLEKKTGLDFQP